ncbi:MAG: hypothetical protein CVU81_00255, partial [Euryarchaeota archaeon HGW-Euryarchaeota-1]
GPAAGGVVIKDESDKIIFEKGFFFGKKTNNQAEYLALIKGLESAKEIGATQIACFLDSELLVKQQTGEYKVRNPLLVDLDFLVGQKKKAFKIVRFFHIPREKNAEADALVNEVLDAHEQSGMNDADVKEVCFNSGRAQKTNNLISTNKVVLSKQQKLINK